MIGANVATKSQTSLLLPVNSLFKISRTAKSHGTTRIKTTSNSAGPIIRYPLIPERPCLCPWTILSRFARERKRRFLGQGSSIARVFGYKEPKGY